MFHGGLNSKPERETTNNVGPIATKLGDESLIAGD
jgi:hypothetical protein